MWLLDKMLRRLVREGELIVTDHDGKVYHYGKPNPDFGRVVARLTDAKAAYSIATNPRLGLGEAYMEGRMVMEEGEIRDLLMLAIRNAPWE